MTRIIICILLVLLSFGCNHSYVKVDTGLVENIIQNPNFENCEWHYDEILYLTLKDYPRSGLAAAKMAYAFWKMDIVLDHEIESLVLAAYEQLIDDAELRKLLTADEIRFLVNRYDKLLPVDWDSEKNKFWHDSVVDIKCEIY